GVLVVEKGQKGKGYYVVDAPKNEAAANEKYKGISYVGTDGKKRMYIEQNGQYFSINSNGYTERLPDNMQKRIKSEGGLSKAFGKNASPINDDEVSELKNKYKSQPKIDYELGNPFNEKGWGANRKKSIYRPRNVRAFGLDENEPEEQRSLADEVVEDMDNSPENEAPSPDYSYYERAMKLLELRYNPYHDPSNGRFCSGGGGGGGGMIVVPKGGKAYGVQINKGYSDEEIDSMYQKYIEEQKVLDNSDKRPYNGVKIERDYKSSAAKFCGKEVYDKMCDDIERCDNKDIAELYASCINDVKFKSSSTKRDKAYYSPQTDTVVITKIGLEKRRQDPQDFERTALHEIGHYIDFHNSENGNWYASQSSETLLSALNNDSKAFVLKYCPNDAKLSKDAKGKQGLAAFNSKYGNNAKTNGTVNISDMVYGSTGIKIYGGHDANYFKISGTRETEALAEIMQSRIMNSKADSILRAEMPRSSASVEILAKSINGRRKQTNDVT
ncbi:MAG: hypothetical protein ACI4XF_02420, partial [Oscillospiraceae bacterium]